MTLSTLFIIVSIVLFVLAVVPNIQRSWMVAVGMAFFAASFLSTASLHLGR